MRRGIPAAAALLAGAGVAVGVASMRWRRASASLTGSLLPDRPVDRPLSAAELDGLPAPVARYLAASLRIDRPVPRFARVGHVGSFRLGDAWKPFTSTEAFALAPPGFLWDARIRAAPMLSVFVRDSYLDGQGSMQAAVAGLLPVVNQRGGAELAAGALQRYLAEAPWLPGALLPRNGVAWEATGAAGARATLADRGCTVSLDFSFDDAGGIVSVFTPARMREVAGRYMPTPWSARVWDYQERGGMRIPLQGEVAWHIDGTARPYWRGRITSYDCASDLSPSHA